MKKILMIFLWVFLLLGEVPADKAWKVAHKWVVFMNQEMRFFAGLRTLPEFFSPEIRQDMNFAIMDFREVYYRGERVGYLAELFPTGYILLPLSSSVSPVKLYSYRGRFQPELVGFHRDVLRLLYLYRHLEGTDKRWKYLLGIPTGKLKAAAGQQVIFGPMVETRWNQGRPYNKYTPTISGYHTPTGCVAVAYSQIMKFWQWPDRGQGSRTYYWETGKKYLSANFSHPYRWDKMPAALNDRSTPEEIDAVARLMYDVGVAVDMDYGISGSGAYPTNAIDTFPRHFKYSKAMSAIGRCLNSTCTEYMEASQWFRVLKHHVDQYEPFEFSIFGKKDGSYFGHAVVVDGYKVSDAGEFIHINMGWGGAYDGFYSVDKIKPGTTNFNVIEWEYAVVNIYPANLPPAPSSVRATRHRDRGIFVNRYVDVVEWDAPPGGEGSISAYEVLRWDTSSGFIITQGKVEVGQDRKVEINVGTSPKDYRYAVRTISRDGKKGKPSPFVVPRLNQ